MAQSLGVGGVIKGTGKKVIFQKEKNEWWFVFNDNIEFNIGYKPKEIRLDHEPEYKEIPFSEATHEQRMCVENLTHKQGYKITDIHKFSNGKYGYTVDNYDNIWHLTSNITVKVTA